MFYTALSIVTILLGAVAVYFSLRFLWRHNWFLGWIKGMFGLCLLAIGVIFALLAFDVFSYKQIVKEQSVATINFERLGTQRYQTTLVISDGTEKTFELRGDQWQMDARLVKWQGFVGGLGIKPAYRLDRLSGRYNSLEQERTAERTVYSLAPAELGVDLWRWLNQRPHLVPMVDAVYGSATFLPMADGAIYEVTLSHTGLVARPLNDAARNAVAEWR